MIMGKAESLEVLRALGYRVPEFLVVTTREEAEAATEDIPFEGPYAVRSSALIEDGTSATKAGQFLSLIGVAKGELPNAIKKVAESFGGFENGKVIVQEDVTSEMLYSGVLYTNLNGSLVIAAGKNNAVHGIVQGMAPEVEIKATLTELREFRGLMPLPMVEKLLTVAGRLDKDFGFPLDVEFAFLKDEVSPELYLLQARPLPNPTEAAYREQELRRLERTVKKSNFILGVGNYREILGGESGNELSTSVFNKIFEEAVILGRNELGYAIGKEIKPWVIFAFGSVYYVFENDALQFRPKGLSKDAIEELVTYYLARILAAPDLLNYPELRLYVQFPDEAAALGIPSEPYEELRAKILTEIKVIKPPAAPPKRTRLERFGTAGEAVAFIMQKVGEIARNEAREYVKAARMAFYALELVRAELGRLKKENPRAYRELSGLFGVKSEEKLRDYLVYAEPIESYDVYGPSYAYVSSFDLRAPRRPLPRREKRSKSKNKTLKLPEKLEEAIEIARKSLSYREKVKFFLFHAYDLIYQAVEQLKALSGLGGSIYYLYLEELPLLAEKRLLYLAKQKVAYRKAMRKYRREGPLSIDLRCRRVSSLRDFEGYELVFGTLKDGKYPSSSITFIDAVDQAIEIPEGTQLVVVSGNILPGSHLFTLLSDYQLPVIRAGKKTYEKLKGLREVEVRGGKIYFS